MQSINCHIPIKLRITGRPSDAQLDQVGEELVRALEARISFADKTIASNLGHILSSGESEIIQEGFNPAREDHTTNGYLIPSYIGKGTHKSVSLRRRSGKRGRRWYIRKKEHFHASISSFIHVIEELAKPVPDYDLYIGMNELRWVSLWLVQVNHEFLFAELVEILHERANQLWGVRSNQKLQSVGYTATNEDRMRKLLIEIDQDHKVVSKIPSLSSLNKIELFGGEAENLRLKPSAWMLFASMVVPKIELGKVADLGSEIQITLRLRDLTFVVPPKLFEYQHKLSWEAYIREFGNQPATVHLQPMTIKQRIDIAALEYLVEQEVKPRISNELISNETIFYNYFYILNNTTLRKLPTNVRDIAKVLTNDETLNLNDNKILVDLMPNWKAVYVYTVLKVSQRSINIARYRPQARDQADSLIELMRGSLASVHDQWPFEDFIRRHYTGRPIEFELLLDNLKQRDLTGRLFNRLFEAVEEVGNYRTVRLVIELALKTRYVNHSRVQNLIDFFNGRHRARLRHSYNAKQQQVVLDLPLRYENVPIGDVFGDHSPLYIREKKEYRPKNHIKDALTIAVLEEAASLMGRIERGIDQREYSEAKLEEVIVTEAVQRLNLTENDFNEVTIQNSIRLLHLEHIVSSGYRERVFVTYELVWREEGNRTWLPVNNISHQRVSDSKFDSYLWQFEFEKSSAVVTIFAKGVVVIAVVVIAWEVGVVKALVSIAGGAKVVLTSIAISEILYLIFADNPSWEGALLAALDGYLGALVFRGAGITMRHFLPARIVTQSVRGAYIAWFAERLGIGIIGGGGTGALARFNHDLLAVVTGRGSWSTAEEYAQSIGWGMLLGIGGEFVGAIVLEPLVSGVTQSALHTAADVANLLFRNRISSVGWSAWSVQFRSKMWQKIKQLKLRNPERVQNVIAGGYQVRLTQVADAFINLGRVVRGRVSLSVHRRLLQLAEIELSAGAIGGLERMLSASVGHLDDAVLVRLVNGLTSNPTQAIQFLEFLNGLSERVIGGLTSRGYLMPLFQSPGVLNFAAEGNLNRIFGLVGRGSNPSEVLPALERFMQRNAGLTPLEMRTAIDQMRKLHLGSAAEIEAVGSVAAQQSFPGGVPRAIENMRHLISDDVYPLVAGRELQLPSGQSVRTVEVAGPGRNAPDVLITTTGGQHIGREATSSTVRTTTNARAKRDLSTNLKRRIEEKVEMYNPGGTADRASLNYISREIGVQIRSSRNGIKFDLHLTPEFLTSVIRRVRGTTNIGRINAIRFYDSNGNLVFTWTH